MKLHTSGASPFGRKVKVLAIETGLIDRLELHLQQVSPVTANAAVAADNPLGKIPCLVTDDGLALYDSRVICEYLDELHDGTPLFPAAGPERWRALSLQALGDGLIDAGILVRYEALLRPEERRSADWTAGQRQKMVRALDRLEALAPEMAGRLDIGGITAACALGWLDFRFADDAWRQSRSQLATWYANMIERPSLQRTMPAA